MGPYQLSLHSKFIKLLYATKSLTPALPVLCCFL